MPALDRAAVLACAASLAVAAACSGGGPGDGERRAAEVPTVEPAETAAADDRPWPVPDWEQVGAEVAGFDQASLDALAAAAEAGGSTCLVVTRDGQLVGEWYWDGTDAGTRREAFSATKSITSTLVGIAQDRGLLDLDEPASRYIEEWQGTPSEDVTIRNLVSNDSGRYHDMGVDYGQMALQAPDKTAFSIELDQQHEPGTTWVYNNAAIQTLDAVLRAATRMEPAELAEEALFGPIGMDAEIGRDPAGNTLMFMGAQVSCRDLARFGLLFLRGGEWDGSQVVSEAWVEEATSPSTDLNTGYGYLWWLNRPGLLVGGDGQASEGQLVPGAPEDLYAALGLYGQVVAVFPSSDVVVTRLGAGEGPDGAAFGVGEIATQIPAALTGSGP